MYGPRWNPENNSWLAPDGNWYWAGPHLENVPGLRQHFGWWQASDGSWWGPELNPDPAWREFWGVEDARAEPGFVDEHGQPTERPDDPGETAYQIVPNRRSRWGRVPGGWRVLAVTVAASGALVVALVAPPWADDPSVPVPEQSTVTLDGYRIDIGDVSLPDDLSIDYGVGGGTDALYRHEENALDGPRWFVPGGVDEELQPHQAAVVLQNSGSTSARGVRVDITISTAATRAQELYDSTVLSGIDPGQTVAAAFAFDMRPGDYELDIRVTVTEWVDPATVDFHSRCEVTDERTGTPAELRDEQFLDPHDADLGYTYSVQPPAGTSGFFMCDGATVFRDADGHIVGGVARSHSVVNGEPSRSNVLWYDEGRVASAETYLTATTYVP